MKLKTALELYLKNIGITTIYGVPGREGQYINFDEVEGLEFLTTRVEFTASIAGQVSASLTNNIQAVFATMGPGATNLTTGVASAMLNHSPVLFLTSQLESFDKNYNYTHQCVDQSNIFSPITKYSTDLETPNDLFKILKKATKEALTEPMGPVHIAIPCDFFDADIDVPSDFLNFDLSILRKDISNASTTDNSQLKEIVESIKKSEKPLAILGSEICRDGSYESVIKFCHKFNIPFFTSPSVKGISDFDADSLNLGTASCYMEGIYGSPVLDGIFQNVDLIILIGYQYVDDLLPNMWNRGINKKILCINLTKDVKLEKIVRSDYCVFGSIEKICTELNKIDCIVKKSSIAKNCILDSLINHSEEKKGLQTLSPYEIISELNSMMKNGILVTDIGYFRHHVSLFSKPVHPHTLVTDTAISSFGSGLPSAIAAKKNYPDKDVILICGDGGFHSCSGDLATLVKYNLPILIVVMNNSSFELIHLYQQNNAGNFDKRNANTKLSDVDFVKLAEANGCCGVRAFSVDDLRKHIRSWDKKSTLLIEVALEYTDNCHVSF